MPCWYFDKSELKTTPSLRDGIDSEKEARYRREGARFLMECGINMGLRYDTMATGVVFFHRFYMFHSFNEFPRYVMAACCLFLAGKVEETPKKCKDIVKAAKTWLESKQLDKYIASFGEEPIKDIMIYEKILLQTIKFDLQVDHPYGYLLKYAKTLKGDQEQIRAMVQMAWTFINDSYCTTLCLQWEPEIIAIALMYLTSKLSKLEIKDWIAKKENGKQNWWEQFVEGLELDILDDICHQFLDLYSNQQQPNKKPPGLSTDSPGQEHSNTIEFNNGQYSNHASASKRNTPPDSTSPRLAKRANPIGDGYPNGQIVASNHFGNGSFNLGDGLLPPPQMPPLTTNASYSGMYGMMPPGSMIPNMNGSYNAAGVPPGQSMPPPPPPPPQHHHHHMGLYSNPTQPPPPSTAAASAPSTLQMNPHYTNMYSQGAPQQSSLTANHMHPSAMMPVNANYPQSIQPGLFPTPPSTQGPSNAVSTPTTPATFSYPPLYSSNPPNPTYDPYTTYPPIYNNGMPGLAGPAPMGVYNGLKDPTSTSILGIDPPRVAVGSKPMYAPSSSSQLKLEKKFGNAMPCWYFDKNDLENTPSLREGMEPTKEARYRREGARLVMECGHTMGLRYDTMATGVVFFHRFYMFHSFNEFPRYVMAACCLFLAGKVEETPKKCKDIVKAAKTWLESKQLDKYIASFGEEPIKDIMIYEKILLQTIKFDLQVDHPYGYLLKYAKTLKGNEAAIKSIVQSSWTFINDSLSTTLCLQWEPEVIAIAFMYLAGKMAQFQIETCVDMSNKENQSLNWWDQFVEDLSIEVLEDICHQILDLYVIRKEEQELQLQHQQLYLKQQYYQMQSTGSSIETHQ